MGYQRRVHGDLLSLVALCHLVALDSALRRVTLIIRAVSLFQAYEGVLESSDTPHERAAMSFPRLWTSTLDFGSLRCFPSTNRTLVIQLFRQPAPILMFFLFTTQTLSIKRTGAVWRFELENSKKVKHFLENKKLIKK